MVTEMLNEGEKRILLAFADNDMSVQRTAKFMHTDSQTLLLCLKNIGDKFNVNMHKFWTLHFMISTLLGEEERNAERKTLQTERTGM